MLREVMKPLKLFYVFLTSTSCIYSSHLLLNLPWNVINMSSILTEKVRR